MTTIQINGQTIEAEAGSMLIRAADDAGIIIGIPGAGGVALKCAPNPCLACCKCSKGICIGDDPRDNEANCCDCCKYGGDVCGYGGYGGYSEYAQLDAQEGAQVGCSSECDKSGKASKA